MSDDAMTGIIVVAALIGILLFGLFGCDVPGKVDGDERPPEQGSMVR